MDCLSKRKKFKNKHRAWSDPNDPREQQDIIIENQPEHEEKCDNEQSDSEDDQDGDNFDMYANDVRSKKLTLEDKELQFKHLTNLNNERSYTGCVKQVKFHPTSKIALVTLSKGQADLFEVDGERNRYIQNIKLPRTQTPFCTFKSDGESIIISSEDYKGSFFTYDMISNSIQKFALKVGNDTVKVTDFIINDHYMACREEGSQEVCGLSAKTFENNFSIKVNEPVKALKFSSNNEIFVAGYNGRVYVYDLRKASICKHKFRDEGNVHITSFDLSESSNLVAIGSDSGLITTYELENCLSQLSPKPLKSFNNLAKSVDIIKFNSTGELLLVASSEEPGGFRMIHSHSNSVYRNFPVPKKKYGSLFSADFSPLSGYLSLGCSTGRAHLCRLPYYKSY